MIHTISVKHNHAVLYRHEQVKCNGEWDIRYNPIAACAGNKQQLKMFVKEQSKKHKVSDVFGINNLK